MPCIHMRRAQILLSLSLALTTSTIWAAPPAHPGAIPSPSSRKATPMPARPTAPAVAVSDSSLRGGIMMEPTEFVDQEIRDVLRAIAKAYDLNIFPYPEVKGKVTVTLHRMPVLDALRNLVEPLGYELAWDGQAYQVRQPRLKAQGTIEVARNALSMTVRNQDIQQFAEEYGKRTGLNILVDRNAKGQVSGTLRGVDAIDGLKAILTASGFELRAQGEAWIVSGAEDRPQNNPYPTMRGGRVDLSIRKGLVTANLKQAPLTDVVQQLADQGGYNSITWGQLGGTVDANLKDVPLFRALELILQGTPFTYAIQDSILVIGDRNPASASGQALAKTELYFLRHLRADKVVPLLPKNLPTQGVQSVAELNALLLSGTAETIAKFKEFLESVDQEVPQVILEAVIVEFSRKKTSELGMRTQATSAGVSGPTIASNIHINGSDKASQVKVGPFDFGTLTLLPQDFMLQLNALENAELAKVLARPRLTTLNGQPATINIGNADYFQVSTIDKNGLTSTDYRAFNSGITLTITPYLTKSGFITAEIKPEVRTPSSTASSDANKPPSTSTRSLSTNVRLRDGQTLILGGLIQTLDLNSQSGIPILSAIPLIGKLFTYRTRNKQTTELAIYITPRVMSVSDSSVDIRKAMDIMEKRINGLTVDLPFARDPLPPAPEAVGHHPKSVEPPAAVGNSSQATAPPTAELEQPGAKPEQK
ncbi:MAG: type II secretion system protein GspD [Fibrobacteres bacterium]|nr:type II secretion system protein GspD [Fibrobacterota bacterium]